MSVAQGARRRRPALPLALAGIGLAVLVTAAVVFGVTAGGSSSEGQSGPLSWTGPTREIPAPGLPRDRILSGTIRNDSLRVAEVEASSLRVIDAEGRPLLTGASFVGSFVRGIYGASRASGASDFERRRTGRLLRLGPGEKRPLTVSWRMAPDRTPAQRIDYGPGSLPVP